MCLCILYEAWSKSIILQNNISWSVFVIEIQRIFCEPETKFLNIVCINFSLWVFTTYNYQVTVQFINIQIICSVIDVLMHDSITALLLNIFNIESLLNEIEQHNIDLLLRTVLLVRK